jgi:hypothetical protein
MGNDMSVFEEGELEKDFWKAYGPKNESENVIVCLYSRCYRCCVMA